MKHYKRPNEKIIEMYCYIWSKTKHSTLPHQDKSKFITNMIQQNRIDKIYTLYQDSSNMWKILNFGLNWTKTKEGFNYWSIVLRIMDNNHLKNIIKLIKKSELSHYEKTIFIYELIKQNKTRIFNLTGISDSEYNTLYNVVIRLNWGGKNGNCLHDICNKLMYR